MGCLWCAIFSTLVNFSYLGSTSAFNATISGFVVMISISYLTALLPFSSSANQASPKDRFFVRGLLGYLLHGFSCAFLIVAIVIFSFPYEMPVDAENMNYSALVVGGCTIFICVWWFVCRNSYKAPVVMKLHSVK
jgi:hypothetical protein